MEYSTIEEASLAREELRTLNTIVVLGNTDSPKSIETLIKQIKKTKLTIPAANLKIAELENTLTSLKKSSKMTGSFKTISIHEVENNKEYKKAMKYQKRKEKGVIGMFLGFFKHIFLLFVWSIVIAFFPILSFPIFIGYIVFFINRRGQKKAWKQILKQLDTAQVAS